MRMLIVEDEKLLAESLKTLHRAHLDADGQIRPA